MTNKRKANHPAYSLEFLSFLIVLSETDWGKLYFLGLPLLLCLLIVSGLIWYQKEKSLRRKAQQLRKRIAEDFHDELGSRLTIISMYSELILREVPQDNELARHYLKKISQASNGLYQAMKDMLWTLDPSQDSLDDLLIKIKDFGEDLFEDSDTDFSMNGIERQASQIMLSLEHKRHLLLLLKEGLHNAFRHAGARRVTFHAHTDHNTLTIRLSDDGQGFDPAGVAEGEGLKNMKHRARKIGARFQLSSSGDGTTLTIQCPVNH